MSDVPTYAIPYTREDKKAFLKPTVFIQSTDKTLVAKAQEIVGDEVNSLKAVKLIMDWVFRTIEKKPTLSIPSALDILKVKWGTVMSILPSLLRSAGRSGYRVSSVPG